MTTISRTGTTVAAGKRVKNGPRMGGAGALLHACNAKAKVGG
jgi:hypothetical protein